MSELWRKGAVELAAMIRDRDVSSREVIQAHLDRIKAVNPHLNAIVRLLPDQALAAADAADQAVADGSRLGPLHGGPAGHETAAGSVHGLGRPPVSRLRTRAPARLGPGRLGHGAYARHGLARRWSLWYQEYPVLLSPVWSQPAFPLGFDIASLDNAIATLELMRPVLPANLLGTPAAVVPAGMAEGLPVGVQVMGGRYTELRCLAVAEAIEQRLGPLTPIDPVTG